MPLFTQTCHNKMTEKHNTKQSLYVASIYNSFVTEVLCLSEHEEIAIRNV